MYSFLKFCVKVYTFLLIFNCAAIIIGFMSRLSRKISKKTTISEKDIQQVLRLMNECILEDLQKENASVIPGIGTLHVKDTTPHLIKNIHNGQLELTGASLPTVKMEFYKGFRQKCQGDR